MSRVGSVLNHNNSPSRLSIPQNLTNRSKIAPMKQTEITRAKAVASSQRQVHDHRMPTALRHRNEGKALREQCPRSSHSDVGHRNGRRDPLIMLRVSNNDRIKSLVPVRHSRMIESPFAFFRGSAIVQANDLSDTPATGISV